MGEGAYSGYGGGRSGAPATPATCAWPRPTRGPWARGACPPLREGLRLLLGGGGTSLRRGGGEPRVCLARRLEHLARSALRGGRKGRELVEGLWVCVAHLEGVFPPEFLPVLKATRQALEHLQGQGA